MTSHISKASVLLRVFLAGGSLTMLENPSSRGVGFYFTIGDRTYSLVDL